MIDDYTGEPFRSRGVSPEVAEERGYARYENADDVLAIDDRLATGTYFDEKAGKTKRLRDWVAHYASRGSGWVMPKHALPGSPSLDPLPQLRPDDPVPGVPFGHDHDGIWHVERDCPCGSRKHRKLEPEGGKRKHEWLAGWPYGYEPPLGEYERELHERGKLHRRSDGTLITPLKGPHRHIPESKYLIPPGPHGKRWDTHPFCTADKFLAAERVFAHLEGTLKCDSLVSADEVAIDVPSVTLWNRREDEGSTLDYPPGGSFWEEWRQVAQSIDLLQFVERYLRAPVVVVCDSDWRHNAEVATQAFCLRDWFRARRLPCVVAAPPEGPRLYVDPRTGRDVRKKDGSDDWLARGRGRRTVEDLVVVEPTKVPGLVAFEFAYARAGAGASGRRRPASTVELDVAVLEWYATHSTAAGHVKRPAATIAGYLGVSDDAVYDATVRLAGADAFAVEGQYAPIVDKRLIRGRRQRLVDLGRGQRETATIRLRDDLRPERWEPTVGAWLRSLG